MRMVPIQARRYGAITGKLQVFQVAHRFTFATEKTPLFASKFTEIVGCDGAELRYDPALELEFLG